MEKTKTSDNSNLDPPLNQIEIMYLERYISPGPGIAHVLNVPKVDHQHPWIKGQSVYTYIG
jgi:hypothetical protein